jgi:hypothetical protein
MSEEEKIEIVILGITIGTATEWDEAGELFAAQFYEVEINADIFDKEIPNGAAFEMSLDRGEFAYYVEDEKFDLTLDMKKLSDYAHV